MLIVQPVVDIINYIISSILNSLQASPDRRVLQLIFVFLPPILAAAFTHALPMQVDREERRYSEKVEKAMKA